MCVCVSVCAWLDCLPPVQMCVFVCVGSLSECASPPEWVHARVFINPSVQNVYVSRVFFFFSNQMSETRPLTALQEIR